MPITDVAKIRSFLQTTYYCFGSSIIVFGVILLRVYSVPAPHPITKSRYGGVTEKTRR